MTTMTTRFLVTVTIDGQFVQLEPPRGIGRMSVQDIIVTAGQNPATHYLVERRNMQRLNYKDQRRKVIDVFQNQRFEIHHLPQPRILTGPPFSFRGSRNWRQLS